jgi:glutathione S-transferase
MTLRLVTIGFSHYCEKARWALDRAGLEYVEESHAPLFHVPSVLRAGGKRTVPVLVDTVTRQRFADSTDILVEVDRRVPGAGLYPRDPALRRATLELEELFDRDLGPAARRVGYYHLLHGGEAYARELIVSAATPWSRLAVHASYPVIARAIQRGLKIDAAGYERSMKKLEEVFGLVGETLEAAEREGRSWLVGDDFTAADLTFAALSIPVLATPDSGFTFPPATLLPPEASRLAERLAATRAGAHALQTMATQRRRNIIG